MSPTGKRPVFAVLALFLLTAWMAALVAQAPSAGRDQAAKPTPESVTRDSLALFRELAQVLEGVRGRATALEAVEKVRDIADKLQSLKKAAEEMAAGIDEKESAFLKEKYEKEAGETFERLGKAIGRLTADEAAWAELQPVMKDIPVQ